MDYDKVFMSEEDYGRIKMLKDQWAIASDDVARSNVNKAAESIRANYGYSGGTSGGEYNPITSANRAPAMGSYSSSYDDLIDSTLSSILDRPDFSYDPNTDEAYQAFMKNVNRSAERTFDDTIAGASVGSGGRPNSWAGTVAANAMGDMLMQGAAEMPTFRDAAYRIYQQEGQLDFQQLEALMGLDQVAYGRFVDEYNAEVDQFKNSLTGREMALNEALSRTQMTGYVSNADSMILGVAAGTPSQKAMESAMAIEEYLAKAQIDLQYAKSPGSPGKDLMDYNDVRYSMLDSFGKDSDGVIGGTAEEKGEHLYALYQAGQISYESMVSYASRLKAKLPTEQGSSGKNFTPAQKNAATMIQSILFGPQTLVKTLAQKREEAIAAIDKRVGKDLTEAEAKEVLASFGIIF